MNTTTQTMQPHAGRASAFKWLAAGSVTEAIVAIAIIALSIVGLAGVYSMTMAAIAAIITAAAILIEGGAFEMAVARREVGESRLAYSGTGPGLSTDSLGAVAGIVLGILALMNVVPMTLLSVAVLIFGVTLFLSSCTMSERGWTAGSMDGQVLLGLSVTVLGLLSVIGISSLTLVLVGLLILGAAGLFGGSARSFKVMQESKYSGS
jgi:hypothetical protein